MGTVFDVRLGQLNSSFKLKIRKPVRFDLWALRRKANPEAGEERGQTTYGGGKFNHCEIRFSWSTSQNIAKYHLIWGEVPEEGE